MKILIVEDNQYDLKQLKFSLSEQRQQEAKFRYATRIATARSYLEREDIACVILDLNLPDSSGVDTYLTIRGAYPKLPIVVVTNDTTPGLADQLAELGAKNFVIKDFRDPLPMWIHVQRAIDEGAGEE